MLSKERRLNLKKDFKWVASGKRLSFQRLNLFIKFGDNPYPKIGIATSKKNFKNATDRNRSRRLVSKAFEDIYDNLPKNINIVALPKSGVVEVESEILSGELASDLKNEGIIDNSN